VSAYGQSKLGAEREVREGCQVPFVILRPPAVYGPRDHEFLALFKMIRARLAIQFGGGRMPLSLVYVRDLAVTAVEALTHPQAAGRTYNVASPEVVTTAQLADEIAVQMQVRPLRVPLPTALLWPVCVGLEAVSKITGQATVLTRQKHPELRAPGWVCDPARLRDEMRVTCPTSCRSGVGETLSWYRQAGWL
jgi:nucleoside-diphosphate-sugar epimerase